MPVSGVMNIEFTNELYMFVLFAYLVLGMLGQRLKNRCHSANCHHLNRVVFSSVRQLCKMESFIKRVREWGVWQQNDEQGSTF